MNEKILDIYNMLQEVAWFFGNRGFDGECCEDLSLVEFMALKKALTNGGCSVRDVGSVLNFTKSGATRIIDRLENKGYAIRENSPVDGRVCCVAVTAKGKEVMAKILDNYTAYLEDVLKDIEPQKVEIIRDALEALLNALQNNKSFNPIINRRKGEERF